MSPGRVTSLQSFFDRGLSEMEKTWQLELVQYAEFGGDAHFSCFGPKNSLFGQLWSEKLNLFV